VPVPLSRLPCGANNVGSSDELWRFRGRRSRLDHGYQPSAKAWVGGIRPRHDADPHGHLVGTVLGGVDIKEPLALLVKIGVNTLGDTAVIRH
jgi:hypothetical protein